MQSQDELDTLFFQKLSLHNAPLPVPAAPTLASQATQAEEPITYSITQHYHHSAHVASQRLSRPVSTPPSTDQETTEIILGRHGVDVKTLFPSQIELFKSADAGQQMRLVELWRISPPNYGGHALAHDLGNWPATSMQQEEVMAQLRYERQMMEERACRTQTVDELQHFDGAEDMMSDGEQSNAPMTPIQGGDGRWIGPAQLTQQPEPYMASGYESLAQREYDVSAGHHSKDVYSHFGTAVGGASYIQAVDPVYKNVNNGWATQTQEQQQQTMEDQYGAFAQNRHYGSGVLIGEDEEML